LSGRESVLFFYRLFLYVSPFGDPVIKKGVLGSYGSV
jgi:hypothetical protein